MSEERIIAEIITLIKYKNKEYEVRDLINYLCNELEKRDNIIKEAIEYIEQQKLHKFQDTTGGLTYEERKLLEILDKENN